MQQATDLPHMPAENLLMKRLLTRKTWHIDTCLPVWLIETRLCLEDVTIPVIIVKAGDPRVPRPPTPDKRDRLV
jgi:hypothetical protein